LRPSDKKTPASVAFVQCAGSRDRNYLPYCSAVCCSASLKHALNITELLPEAKVTIFYIDLRVIGRNEDFLKRVEAEKNVQLIKGKVASIQFDEKAAQLLLEVEDIVRGKKMTELFDMVVLATGIVPESTVPGLNINDAGFLAVNQMDGIFPAACAKKPMDVSASVKDATSAAVKAMKN
jgi:quinone-modifying oxidoreductase subunit QmoA